MATKIKFSKRTDGEYPQNTYFAACKKIGLKGETLFPLLNAVINFIFLGSDKIVIKMLKDGSEEECHLTLTVIVKSNSTNAVINYDGHNYPILICDGILKRLGMKEHCTYNFKILKAENSHSLSDTIIEGYTL